MSERKFPAYPVWVEVDLKQYRANLRTIRNHLPPRCELIIVLKSDAYGHGTVELAKAARQEGRLGRIGIATNEEARWLREAGFDNPIVKLVPSLPDEFEDSITLGIEEIVSDRKTAERLAAIGKKMNRPARIHIGLATGMGRKGFLDSGDPASILETASVPGLEVIGMMTHFPSADDADKSFTLKQIESFSRVRKELARKGLPLRLCHVANSAALLDLPESHLEGVRAGLITFGMYPSEHDRRLEGIEPILSFHTRVALVRTVPAGRSIGYTRSYITPSERVIATLPLGYNDGYWRQLSNRGQVLIRGKRAPVVGVVSMNLVTVDVTGIEGVEPGDEVVLFGKQGGQFISAEEFGLWAGTINYEVTTRIGTRNHRIYRDCES